MSAEFFLEPTGRTGQYDLPSIQARRTLWDIVCFDLHWPCSIGTGLDSLGTLQFSLPLIFLSSLPLDLIVFIIALLHSCAVVFVCACSCDCTSRTHRSGCFGLCGSLPCAMCLYFVGSILHDHCGHPLLRQCHVFDLLETHRRGKFRICICNSELDRLNDRIVMPINFCECTWKDIKTLPDKAACNTYVFQPPDHLASFYPSPVSTVPTWHVF